MSSVCPSEGVLFSAARVSVKIGATIGHPIRAPNLAAPAPASIGSHWRGEMKGFRLRRGLAVAACAILAMALGGCALPRRPPRRIPPLRQNLRGRRAGRSSTNGAAIVTAPRRGRAAWLSSGSTGATSPPFWNSGATCAPLTSGGWSGMAFRSCPPSGRRRSATPIWRCWPPTSRLRRDGHSRR